MHLLFEQLIHVIMEAVMSQDLQGEWASRKSKRADGFVPVEGQQAQDPGRADISIQVHVCGRAQLLQLCPTLCSPMDYSLPGSSVHGIFQARVLEWIAISFSRGSSRPRDRTRVSLIVDRCFTIWATREGNLHLPWWFSAKDDFTAGNV